MVKEDRAGISVIMPCYNAGAYIRDAVQSVFDHNITNRPLELIIIDDDSTDPATHAALEELERYPDVHIFRQTENQGPGAARNVGLHAAQYPFVTFVDADDLMNNHPDLLKDRGSYFDRGIDILEQDPDTVFVHGSYHDFGTKTGYNKISIPNEKWLLTSGGPMVFVICRKLDALSAGGCDEKLKHNIDWAFALCVLNKRVKAGQERDWALMQEPYYLYRHCNDNSNVSARPKDWPHFFERIAKHCPELIALHYPLVSEENRQQFLSNRHASSIRGKFIQSARNPHHAVRRLLSLAARTAFGDHATERLKSTLRMARDDSSSYPYQPAGFS